MDFYNCYFYIKSIDTDEILDTFFYIDKDDNTLFTLKNYKYLNKCLPCWNENHIQIILSDISNKYNYNYKLLSKNDLHYHNIILEFIKLFLNWSLEKEVYVYFKIYKFTTKI